MAAILTENDLNKHHATRKPTKNLAKQRVSTA